MCELVFHRCCEGQCEAGVAQVGTPDQAAERPRIAHTHADDCAILGPPKLAKYIDERVEMTAAQPDRPDLSVDETEPDDFLASLDRAVSEFGDAANTLANAEERPTSQSKSSAASATVDQTANSSAPIVGAADVALELDRGASQSSPELPRDEAKLAIAGLPDDDDAVTAILPDVVVRGVDQAQVRREQEVARQQEADRLAQIQQASVSTRRYVLLPDPLANTLLACAIAMAAASVPAYWTATSGEETTVKPLLREFERVSRNPLAHQVRTQDDIRRYQDEIVAAQLVVRGRFDRVWWTFALIGAAALALPRRRRES